MQTDVLPRSLHLHELLPHSEHASIYGSVDPAFEVLCERITDTNHVDALVVSVGTPGLPDGTIISGHRRYAVAVKLGRITVPVECKSFPSAAAALRTMVLLNEHREKDEWTKTMESLAILRSYEVEARERKLAGRKVRQTSVAKAATSPDATSPLAAVSETPASDHERSPEESSLDPQDGTTSHAGSGGEGARNDAAWASPPDGRQRPRKGEALRLAATELRQGKTTVDLRRRLWDEACRQNEADPSASAVAAALREPGVKVEAVARRFRLVPPPVRTGSSLSGADAMATLLATTASFHAQLERLLRESDQPVPGATASTSSTEPIADCLRLGVQFLNQMTPFKRRLVFVCPRVGEGLMPLARGEIHVSMTRLWAAVGEARAAGWSPGAIGRAAGLKDVDTFREWCAATTPPVVLADLYQLVRWVETSRGEMPPKVRKLRAARAGEEVA